MSIPTEKIKSASKKFASKEVIIAAVTSTAVGAVGGAFAYKQIAMRRTTITVGEAATSTLTTALTE